MSTLPLFKPADVIHSEDYRFPDIMTPSGAVFSRCNQYRPLLWRWWGPGHAFLHVCGLNPSTADAEKNDPTIRREIGFAKLWGYDGLIKTNAFDFRATDPKVMLAHAKPNSDENDWFIARAQGKSAPPYGVAAWGIHGAHQFRNNFLRALMSWKCLGLTKDGHPRHPLYVKADTKLVPLP